jgi:hypothetical protein
MKVQRDELIEGQVVWCFYFDVTNKGNKVREYTGIWELTVTEVKSRGYDYVYNNVRFTKRLGKWPYPINHNIDNRVDADSVDMYTTKEEAEAGHDKALKDLSKGQNTTDRAAILSKLIVPAAPKKSAREIKATKWFLNLTADEKKNVEWIKDYYEEI